MEESKKIAQKLKFFGENNFKTNVEFAKNLDMTAQSLDKYLKGERIPGGKILAKLLKLGCDINSLLSEDEPKKLVVNEEKETYKAIDERLNNIQKNFEERIINLEAEDYPHVIKLLPFLK